MKSLICKFDTHKWFIDETKGEEGEWTCSRCGISCSDCVKRSDESIWYCGLKTLRSYIYYPVRYYITASDVKQRAFTDNKEINRARFLRVIILGSAMKFIYEVVTYVLSMTVTFW